MLGSFITLRKATKTKRKYPHSFPTSFSHLLGGQEGEDVLRSTVTLLTATPQLSSLESSLALSLCFIKARGSGMRGRGAQIREGRAAWKSAAHHCPWGVSPTGTRGHVSTDTDGYGRGKCSDQRAWRGEDWRHGVVRGL